VLIDVGGHAVLTDYDLLFITDSRDFTATVSVRPCRWTAPELMDPAGDGTATLASDVFSYAMTVIEVSFFLVSSQLSLTWTFSRSLVEALPLLGKSAEISSPRLLRAYRLKYLHLSESNGSSPIFSRGAGT